MLNKNKHKVSIIKYNHFSHNDIRRTIVGLTGKLKLTPDIKQMKIILISELSVKNKNIIGNHLHKESSNQWEYIYVLNKTENKDLFEFRYKNHGGLVQKKKLKSGDCAVVPPGCALGLLPLVKDSIIIEISNKTYHDNYEKVELFKLDEN